eukprot:gene17323-19744_t
MDVINTSDGSVHGVDLYVAHEADQYRIISHVNIEYPTFGSILTKKLDIGISRTDDAPISSMHVSIIGVTEMDMSPHTLQIESQQADAEPGELQNLNVALDQVPTVLVAPSWYAAEHESVQRSVRAYKQHSSQPVFDPARFHSSSPSGHLSGGPGVYRHPACKVTGVVSPEQANLPCVVIAFVARLSTEKNPGLFLQAAYEILQVYPFARFTIVGDGALRQSLENLADRLQMTWAVHFTGWVSATALPSLLAGVDIVINPSLRAWSETFCIANIEAMSMGVPLVTFAVGGIGEYVMDPALNNAYRNSSNRGKASNESRPSMNNSYNDSQMDFSVSENAVVVDRATPVALAKATLHLIRQPALRSALGRRGRQIILDHFTVQRQMAQYELLYTKLVNG